MFADYFAKGCFSHTYTDAVRTIVAMNWYKSRHGEYPGSIDLLVPHYLDRLPVDYFTGEALAYSAEHGWFYSVGTNFEDNGGSEEGSFTGVCLGNVSWQEDEACWTNPTISLVPLESYQLPEQRQPSREEPADA